MPGSPSGSAARGSSPGVRRSGARALRGAARARLRAPQHGRYGRALGAALIAALAAAAPAAADTASFAQQGCSQWTIPTGVSSVAIDALGAAGGPGGGSTHAQGGSGG